MCFTVGMRAGAQDPWVKGFWARRLKRRVPALRYFSIDPAGHCPHHEAPETVNSLLAEWVDVQVRTRRQLFASAHPFSRLPSAASHATWCS